MTTNYQLVTAPNENITLTVSLRVLCSRGKMAGHRGTVCSMNELSLDALSTLSDLSQLKHSTYSRHQIQFYDREVVSNMTALKIMKL